MRDVLSPFRVWPILIVLLSSGCQLPHHKVIPSPPVQCVTGPIPWEHSPYFQETYSLTRRELQRADDLSPFSRALLLEEVPAAFPDTASYSGLASCDAYWQGQTTRLLKGRHLHFDRRLVAAVRNITDFDTLWALMQRSDEEIGAYHPQPEETGPLPSPQWLRYVALAQLPTLWNVWNTPRARDELVPYLARSQDDLEKLLAHEAKDTTNLNHLLWRPPELTSPTGKSLTGLAPIRDLSRRLQGPPDEVALQLALIHLSGVGVWARQYRLQAELKPLLEQVITLRGRVPLTRGVEGAAEDLMAEARGALWDLEGEGHPPSQTYLLPHQRLYPDLVTPLMAEPAGGQLREEERLLRLEQLNTELKSLSYVSSRCYVIHQYGVWTPASRGEEVFDQLVLPLFRGGFLRVSDENVCRLETALELPGVKDTHKVQLLLEILEAHPDTHQVDERSSEKFGHMNSYSIPADPLRQSAAEVLMHHPQWIRDHAQLRGWLEKASLEPVPTSAHLAQTWRELTPSFVEVIRFHLSARQGADPEISRAILYRWIDSTRQVMDSLPQASHIYLGENLPLRYMALAWYGADVGLTPEILAFFQSLPPRRLVAVATFLLQDRDSQLYPPTPPVLESPRFITPVMESPPMMMKGG